MTLTELNQQIEALREKRADAHDHLHALLADETLTVGQARREEVMLRSRIRALNKELTPLEMERAEIDRVVKGKPRQRKEPWLDEPVFLG